MVIFPFDGWVGVWYVAEIVWFVLFIFKWPWSEESEITCKEVKDMFESKTQYPYIAARPDLVEEKWKETELFSIAGWFCEDYEGTPFNGNAVAFGGYFKRDVATGFIRGELVDLFGRSEISGNLGQTKSGDRALSFTKVYRESAIFPGLDPSVLPPIGYNFHKTKDGWLGEFVLHSSYRGRAFCWITMAVPDAFGILDKSALTQNPIPGAELSFFDG